MVNVDGQIDVPALYGLDRPDVADFFKNSGCRFLGIWAYFVTSVLGGGQQMLSLRVITVDKKEYHEPSQKIILEVT